MNHRHNQMTNKEIFNDVPIEKAIRKLIFPTVISQIVMVVYEISDIFIVGLTNSDEMMTATTICMPIFMILNAISNLFGVGACTFISRCLGRKEEEKAKDSAAFAIWGSIAFGIFYSLILLLFLNPIIDLIGGKNYIVHNYAKIYLLIVVIFGGLFSILTNIFSALLRSEGRNKHASRGLIIGGITNMILDPILMFVILPKGNEILGTALGTMLSNVISLSYFIHLLLTRYKNNNTIINFKFNKEIIDNSIPESIISNGIPACIMTLFENISFAMLDGLMATYGVIAQAGLGVAKKLNMLAHSCVRGVAQGVMPLLSYNYAAKNTKRFMQSIKITLVYSISIAALCTVIYLLFSNPLISIFIHTSEETIQAGSEFLRILCIGAPFSACIYTFISVFESIGKGKIAFVLALLRKGAIDIPLMYILNRIIIKYGIVLATPITDLIGCIISIIIYLSFLKLYKSEN